MEKGKETGNRKAMESLNNLKGATREKGSQNCMFL